MVLGFLCKKMIVHNKEASAMGSSLDLAQYSQECKAQMRKNLLQQLLYHFSVGLPVATDELLQWGLTVVPDQLLLVIHNLVNHVPSLLVWPDHPVAPHGGPLLGQTTKPPATPSRPLACSPWTGPSCPSSPPPPTLPYL